MSRIQANSLTSLTGSAMTFNTNGVLKGINRSHHVMNYSEKFTSLYREELLTCHSVKAKFSIVTYISNTQENLREISQLNY